MKKTITTFYAVEDLRRNGIANLTRSQALRLSQLNSFLDHLGDEIPFTVKAKTMR